MNDTVGCVAGRLRCLAVWLAGTVALALLLAAVRTEVAAAASAVRDGALAGQPFDRLLVWTCAAVAAVAGTWLWVLTTLVVLEARTAGRRARVPGVPDAVRRVVLLACGVAIASVATPALAGPGPAHLDNSGRSGVTGIQGLPLPDRATGGATLAWLAEAVSPRHVVVRPGDSLWTIAAADLPPGTPDPAVAAHWQRIYALNRAVIGPDPDLIHPDQRLQLPPH